MEEEMKLNEIGMAYYRKSNPKARRLRATAIEHNGGKRTVFGCICVCRHTVATDWRDKTVHLKIWRADHENCAQEWIPTGIA